eukprot:EC720040.1.p1 GENE.EC720040.1~~EC720040.1.p1  ORF type:complete len:61 (+),score=5.30 EC720040.1:35-217(+)
MSSYQNVVRGKLKLKGGPPLAAKGGIQKKSTSTVSATSLPIDIEKIIMPEETKTAAELAI